MSDRDLINHKIEDLQGLYKEVCKRLDRLESRMWAFMATFGGAMILAVVMLPR